MRTGGHGGASVQPIIRSIIIGFFRLEGNFPSGPVRGPTGAEKGPQLRPVKSRFRGRFSQVLEVHLEATNASMGL